MATGKENKQMIDVLFIVYPNMIGMMSMMMRVRGYPYFENAMDKKECSPIWGVNSDSESIGEWLQGLKGKETRLYLSIVVDEPDDTPRWCDSIQWKEAMSKLIDNSQKIVMIDISKENFLYDEIERFQGGEESHDSYLERWEKNKGSFDLLQSTNEKIKRFQIEKLNTRKGVEIFYRETGVRIFLMGYGRNNNETKKMVASTIAKTGEKNKTGGEIPFEDLNDFAERFAICISAHPEYAKRVPALLDEWDRQIGSLPIKKVVLYDHDVVPEFKEGWAVIFPVKAHGQPSPLRNRALEIAVDWIQYWDCDNTPGENHFDIVFKKAYWAKQDVGVLYHDIIGIQGTKLIIPESGDPRRGYFIDTASCWRKEAILSAGAWQVGRTEEDMAIKGVADWALARDIWLAGWKLENTGIELKWENTEGNLTSQYDDTQFRWASRDFAIIILFRGDNELLERVKEDFESLIIPPHCGLTIVTDGDEEFHREVHDWLVQNPNNDRFERKTIFRARKQNCPIRNSEEFMKIHAHVADLYSRAIRARPEELILFWEDDVRPEPEALRALSEQLCASIPRDIGCVGAPYMVRENSYMAAARKKDYWEDPLLMSEITEEPMNVGMLAGGFTLYDRVALEECPMLGPLNVLHKHGFLGWDGFLCKRMNEAGWQIQLCGRSKVVHLPKH